MLKETELTHLRVHLFQIANSFIGEISEDNTILALEPDDSVTPEPVCNHHLIELLSLMNSAVFIHYCESLFSWLAKPENRYSSHPFTLDSYTHFCARNDETKNLFQESVVAHQLPDGSIPIYTAMVEGGDFFSTLWATKILINYDSEVFSEPIDSAMGFLQQKYKITSRSLAQRGFFLFLLLKYRPEDYRELIGEIFGDVLSAAKNIDFSGSALRHINDMYLIEDLLEYYNWSKQEEVLTQIEEKISLLFQLSEEPNLPQCFQRWGDTRPQQPYFQMLLKSGVVLAKYLLSIGETPPTIQLNSHLHGRYREVKYLGLRAEHELKKYKKAYDPIESSFRHYDEELKRLWAGCDAEYDKSIFVMMPFDTDLNFRSCAAEIKKACKKHGFKAFRVDDPHRSPCRGLWENIELNMLSCRFGIAVHVAGKVIDRMDDKPRWFHNPNVSAEFGFMLSRGKKVLILKDKPGEMSSDFRGFKWEEFEIKAPDKTVGPALEQWLLDRKAEVEASEK